MEQLPIEKAAIGSDVEIRDTNGRNYRGTVTRMDTIDGKISLNNVEIKSEDGKTATSSIGQQHFFRHDIESIKFTDEDDVLRRMDPNYFLMKPFRKPYHLRNQRAPNDQEILKLNRPPPPPMTKNTITDSEKETALFVQSNMIDRSQIIDSWEDDSFQAAVNLLKSQRAVAVAAQGVTLSRNGDLCWLAIGIPIPERIYLFDMISLGAKAFEDGLAEILQSTRISKIIHDCRFISDYLFHKHQIFLQNVWDTQVARIVIFKNHHFGDIPRFVDSLPKALQDGLGVDPNEFPMIWYRSHALQEDQSIWRHRPLPDECQRILEAQVKYLWDLRKVLSERMMADFTMGVDFYLKSVRDARKSEVDSMVQSSFLVPAEFQKASDAAAERYAESSAKSAIDPITGFRESMGRLAYWKIRFSKDTWHGNLTASKPKEVEKVECDDFSANEPEIGD